MTTKFSPNIVFVPGAADNNAAMGLGIQARTTEPTSIAYVTDPGWAPHGYARVIELDISANAEAYLVSVETPEIGYSGVKRTAVTFVGLYIADLADVTSDMRIISGLPEGLQLWLDSTTGEVYVMEVITPGAGEIGRSTNALPIAEPVCVEIAVIDRDSAGNLLSVPHVVVRYWTDFVDGSPPTLSEEINVNTGTSAGMTPATQLIIGETTNRGTAPIYYWLIANGTIDGDDHPGVIRAEQASPDGDGDETAWTGAYTDWDEFPPNDATDSQFTISQTGADDVSTFTTWGGPGGSDAVHGVVGVLRYGLSVSGKSLTGSVRVRRVRSGVGSSNSATDTTDISTFKYVAWGMSSLVGLDFDATVLTQIQVGARGLVSDGASTSLRVSSVRCWAAWTAAGETVADLPDAPAAAVSNATMRVVMV